MSLGPVIAVPVAIFHLVAAAIIALFLRRSKSVQLMPTTSILWMVGGLVLANLIVSVLLLELAASAYQAFEGSVRDDLLAVSFPIFLGVQVPFALAAGLVAHRILKTSV